MKNRLKSNLPAKLAGEYGLNRTARALRLDYKGLKKRIEVADSGDLSQMVNSIENGAGVR